MLQTVWSKLYTLISIVCKQTLNNQNHIIVISISSSIMSDMNASVETVEMCIITRYIMLVWLTVVWSCVSVYLIWRDVSGCSVPRHQPPPGGIPILGPRPWFNNIYHHPSNCTTQYQPPTKYFKISFILGDVSLRLKYSNIVLLKKQIVRQT